MLHQHFSGLRGPLLLAEAFAMLAALSWIDYVTGWELSLFVFYAFPIFLVVWYADLRSGLIFALLSALAWWIANWRFNPYVTNWGFAVAGLTRLAYFCFVAVGGTAIRRQRAADRDRIKALERTRELEEEILRVSEHEQRRIGQDLHDDLCQDLAAIGCVATMLHDDLDSEGRPEAATAGEIAGLISDAVVKTRDLARGIFPVQMEGNGLRVALGALVAHLNRLKLENISLIAPHEIQVQSVEQAMHLYRIAQESINNAMKHARARSIIVSLRQEGGELEMSVSDDGAGFSAQPGASGMGLQTMRYRADLMGGQFVMMNNPSGGVTVSCTVRTAEAPENPA
jgi:signal transduction histidine kinase